MAEGFVIKRSDGFWYAGTSDHRAVFSPDQRPATRFPTEAAAQLRCNGLGGQEKHGRTFTV